MTPALWVIIINVFYVLAAFAKGSVDFNRLPSYALPQVQYSELLSLDKFSVNRLVEQLTTLGTVQISGIPKFALSRKEALEDAAECLRHDTHSERRVMNDGSVRYSAGAETVDGVRGPMTNSCGDSAYRLRALIDSVCRQIFLALDHKMQGTTSSLQGKLLMRPNYRSFSQLMDRGNHLEHLHSYFPPASAASEDNIPTMDFHTDAGLMIAMTTGHFTEGPPSIRNGLYITLSDGKAVKAIVSDDALVILMGEGSKNWLNPLLGKPFRVVPHALIVDIPSGTSNSRAWFGKMYLPPTDAVLPMENIPYSRYHQYESDYQSTKYHLPLACGGSLSNSIVVQNQPCDVNGVPGVYCWTQCQSVEELPCGQNAQCVDSNTGEIIEDGQTTHCMSDGEIYCNLQCVSESTNVTTYSDYCYGYGTTMSMTGFFSVASDDQGSTPCVNLLFEDWTLDSETKFAFACLGVLALGIVIQYLNVLKLQTKTIADAYQRRFAKIAVFAVQVVLSYFLMLVAMTYSVELFCMVCVGLTIGFGLFHSSDSKDPRYATADICCPEEKGYDRLSDEVITPID